MRDKAASLLLALVVGLLSPMAAAQAGGAEIKAEGDAQLPDIGPIFFEFGVQDLTPESRVELDKLAKYLVENPELKVTIEGHADERGSSEFNLSLGELRAGAAKKYLVRKGAQDGQVRTLSYGEEQPINEEQNEGAWAKNRRDQFRVGGRLTPGPGDEGFDENANKDNDADKDKNKDSDADKNKNAADDANQNKDDGADEAGQLLGQSYLFWGGIAAAVIGGVATIGGAVGTGVGVYLYTQQTGQTQQYGLYAAIGFGVLTVVGIIVAAVGGGIIAYDQLVE